MATNRSFVQGPDVDTVAGNGLLHHTSWGVTVAEPLKF
jgi:hypothetical protein